MLCVVRGLYRLAQRYKECERSRQRTEVRPENLFGVCAVPFVCLFLLNFARVSKWLFWYAVNRQISLCPLPLSHGLRGRVKKSLQPSFFSSHGCIYTKVAVSTSTMNLCLSCHVTQTVLHTWLHYGISIKTMHFGHYWLSQIGGKFELRENHVLAF